MGIGFGMGSVALISLMEASVSASSMGEVRVAECGSVVMGGRKGLGTVKATKTSGCCNVVVVISCMVGIREWDEVTGGVFVCVDG